jgi:hypothetical protein
MMSSPEMAGATKSSLTQDWLSALRYWLRGRNGVIGMIVLAVVIGVALNWSWLVAVGIAPLLVAVLPCAVMCGLGLCMSKMMGGSCSTSSNAPEHPDTPMANVAPRITAIPEPDRRTPVSVTAKAGALPEVSSGGAIKPAPDRQPQVLKERE